MIDVKEKLVWLLDRFVYDDLYSSEEIADKLIANSVTVQEWIPVKERLPKIGRKCLITNGEIIKIGWIRPDGVWKIGVNTNDLWSRFSLHPPTHWKQLPEPPKED